MEGNVLAGEKRLCVQLREQMSAIFCQHVAQVFKFDSI